MTDQPFTDRFGGVTSVVFTAPQRAQLEKWLTDRGLMLFPIPLENPGEIPAFGLTPVDSPTGRALSRGQATLSRIAPPFGWMPGDDVPDSKLALCPAHGTTERRGRAMCCANAVPLADPSAQGPAGV